MFPREKEKTAALSEERAQGGSWKHENGASTHCLTSTYTNTEVRFEVAEAGEVKISKHESAASKTL